MSPLHTVDPLAEVRIIRKIDEVHELVFESISGDRTVAQGFIQDYFTVSRQTCNRILRSPGYVLSTGNFLSLPIEQAEFAAHGIQCHLRLAEPSPWERRSDDELHHLLFEQGWAELPAEERFAWGQTVRAYFCARIFQQVTEDVEGRVLHLDTRLITDDAGFYLAMGEAVHGPGGYLGTCVDSFNDCFCGDFGIRLPLTVVWHGVDTQRFHQVLDDMRRVGVTLVS